MDEGTPGMPTSHAVDILDGKHDFERGGWTHKVIMKGTSNNPVFEVHESQLHRAQYEEGQKVRVSKYGLQRSAVVKAVRHRNHAFEYDLAVDFEAVKASDIVGASEEEVKIAE